MLVFPILGKLRQKDCDFQVSFSIYSEFLGSLRYIVKSCLEKNDFELFPNSNEELLFIMIILMSLSLQFDCSRPVVS